MFLNLSFLYFLYQSYLIIKIFLEICGYQFFQQIIFHTDFQSISPLIINQMKLYGDITSQGSRAVMTLLEIGKIQYEFIHIDLLNNGTRTKEFLKINKFGHIPFLVHHQTSIPESNSILIYLCQTFQQISHLYGTNAEQHSRVNTILSFYQNEFRPAFFQLIFLKKRFLYTQKAQMFTPTNIKFTTNKMKVLSKIIDKILEENLYITGNQLTIADLLIYYEYRNIDLYGLDWKFQNIEKWRSRVNKIPAVQNIQRKYNEFLPAMREYFASIQPPAPYPSPKL